MAYGAIYPGRVWRDTDGRRIQAHGGSVITVGNRFYWYGENKEFTTGENDVWHWGVRCYSSSDLMNWDDEGIIIAPESDDPSSPLHPTRFMDRPHILYNARTSTYVAWLKIMGDAQAKERFAVLRADAITGPYEMVNPNVNPHGLGVGDFDLAVDERTGKGYLISQQPHTHVYVADLNDEYTDVEGAYSLHFPHVAPPEAREAPAHFERNGMHYLITSGTTGYFPNASEVAVSSDWHGPYEVLGNPHATDTSKTSFGSQISSVFKYPGKDLYIAVADRWRPDLPELAGEDWESGAYADALQEKFHRIFDPGSHYKFSPEDAKDLRINSSIADYVWLPLRFDGERVTIEWVDSWSPEDFA